MPYLSKLVKRLALAGRALPWIPLLAACGAGDAAVGPANEAGDAIFSAIAVSPAAVDAPVGSTVRLTAQARDRNGLHRRVPTVRWTSGDTTIARVDSAGDVTLVGTGTVDILASSGGRKGRARITAGTAVAIASISVGPAAATATVGGTVSFTATLRDSAGGVLTDRQVSWTSSDASVATIASTGVATGLRAGTVTIRAMSGTVSGSATLVVSTPQAASPSSAAANPNEPAGMTRAFDEGFTNSPVGQPTSGWFVETGGSMVSIVEDSLAEGTDKRVLQLKFPRGFGGGNAPMVINWNETGRFPVNSGTLYLRVRVKISSDWSNNGNGMTKFLWPRAGTTNHFAPLNFYTDQFRTGFSLQAAYLNGVDQDFIQSGSGARGTWHDVEYLLVQGTSSSANDGTVRIWVDGALVVNQTKVKFRPNGDPLGWDYLSIVPVFGGGSNPVPHDQYIWIDRMYASVR